MARLGDEIDDCGLFLEQGRRHAPNWIAKPFWPPRRRCHSLHSNYMLNRGYAYSTIIGSKYHGQTLLSHLANLYPHSTPQAW